MADLHPEFDALAELLDDAGEQVVLQLGEEPPEHVHALMRTLGVRVEVGPGGLTVDREAIAAAERFGRIEQGEPVSGKQGQFANAVTTPTAFAAQDYRASIASVHRREQAGDTAVTCLHCGTETDVTEVKHAPTCPSYVAPVKAEKQTGQGTDWEKGRDGKRRSARERNAAGEITAGEQERRHEAVLDAQHTVSLCAFDDCDWRLEGSAGDGRAAAAVHRAEKHPGTGTGKRDRFPKPGQSNVQAGLDNGRAALEAMDAGEPQPVRAVEAPATATADAPDAAKKPRGRPPKWTRETIIERIQHWAAEHGGEPPSSTIWLGVKGYPSPAQVKRVFGSWGNAIAAAGFERPVQGGRSKGSGPGPLAQQPPVEPELVTPSGARLTSPTPPGCTDERGSGLATPPAGRLSAEEATRLLTPLWVWLLMVEPPVEQPRLGSIVATARRLWLELQT